MKKKIDKKIVLAKSKKQGLHAEEAKKIINEHSGKKKAIRTTNQRRNKLSVPTRKKILSKSKPEIIRELIANTFLEKSLSDYLGDTGNWYLGFGGTGDALLLIAACHTDPEAKVLFFVNTGNQSFTSEFFKIFNINTYFYPNLMGRPIANSIYNWMKDQPQMRPSAHLAHGLDYEDWQRHPERYESNLKTISFNSIFGSDSLSNKNTVCFSPCGSSKDVRRQRYLTQEEYNRVLYYLNLRGDTVLITGSEQDFRFYGNYLPSNCYWLTANKLIDSNLQTKKISLVEMLRYINGASSAIAVDTWLKTYTSMAKIPTYVIKTRWNGEYKNYGEDCSDYIFLNPNVWETLKLVTLEELYSIINPTQSINQIV